MSRYYIRIKAGLGSCQLLHSQHSWEERPGEEVRDTEVAQGHPGAAEQGVPTAQGSHCLAGGDAQSREDCTEGTSDGAQKKKEYMFSCLER